MDNSPAAISIAVTLVAYALSRVINARWPSPLTNPVVFVTPCVIVALWATGIDYTSYRNATSVLTLLLGPATAALAVPLYKNRAVLAACAPAALTGMVCGGLATSLVGIALSRVFGLAPDIARGMSIKSATSPIAVQIAPIIGADVSVSAVLAISTGICGALIGSRVLNLCAVRDPFCRGLAFGSIAHGTGTVQAYAEGDLQGAVAAAATGFSAVVVAIAVPRFLDVMLWL